MADRPRLLVIGYGNPLRGDDRAGIELVRRLASRWENEPASDRPVEFMECHQLTPELSERFSRADEVILIDAAAEGLPGSIRLGRIAAGAPAEPFTHRIDPASLAAAAGELFGHAPQVWILSITGSSFELAEQLTPTVQAAMPRAERMLWARLAEDATSSTPNPIGAIEMHEHSLIEELIQQAVELARIQRADAILKLKVRLGPGAHMTNEHFREHFERAALGSMAEGARTECVTVEDESAPDLLLEAVELGFNDCD